MPRQTRRARSQSGTRKRTTPLIPRHLYDGGGPAILEPQVPPASDDDFVLEELEAAPEMASNPLVQRPVAPTKPAPSAFIRRTTPVDKANAAITARLASTDYGYVVGELKRIFTTAAVIVIFLVVVALLRR